MVRKKKNQGAVWISTGLTHKGFTESAAHGQPSGCHPVPVLFRNTHAAQTRQGCRSKIGTGRQFLNSRPWTLLTLTTVQKFKLACGFIFSRQKKFTRACNCQAFLQASTASESQRLLNLLSACPFTQFHSTLRLL